LRSRNKAELRRTAVGSLANLPKSFYVEYSVPEGAPFDQREILGRHRELFPTPVISPGRGGIMREAPQRQHVTNESPWHDIMVVIGVTLLGVVVSIYFNLNEALYALTRSGERYQLDELPIGVLVLLIGLMWLSWRRYEQARRELRGRRTAEARLGVALAENRELAQENRRIQEVERKHLARELHDEFGQYLNAIKLDAVSICNSGGQEPEFLSNASLSIIRTVDHVHRAVSDMIGRLRPVGLDELGLVAAIEHCVDDWRRRLPDTTLILSLLGNLEDLSEPVNLTLYRLIQEGLTNISKHAKATRAEVTLERIESAERPSEVRLTVADDGCGMEPARRTSRFGLRGMQERVEMAGGSFVLESAPGGGLSFAAHLPAHGER
jgi:two-component system, NarL family, sensor histidine kinase UhpB